jgi:hypothetical protein
MDLTALLIKLAYIFECLPNNLDGKLYHIEHDENAWFADEIIEEDMDEDENDGDDESSNDDDDDDESRLERTDDSDDDDVDREWEAFIKDDEEEEEDKDAERKYEIAEVNASRNFYM